MNIRLNDKAGEVAHMFSYKCIGAKALSNYSSGFINNLQYKIRIYSSFHRKIITTNDKSASTRTWIHRRLYN